MEAISVNPTNSLSRVPLTHPPEEGKHPIHFPTYLETPGVSPRAKIFCEILIKTHLQDVETTLSSTGIASYPQVVEDVLKSSYGSPKAAMKFFGWAGSTHKHSLDSWKLMLDLLGKNQFFESMWDVIRSMKKEGLLSIDTFVAAFGIYCSAGRFKEALKAFDSMNDYGVQPNVVAVNYLLRGLCRQYYSTKNTLKFFGKIKKKKIDPDADSFTILLERWDKEGNVANAMKTLGEMVVRLGWSPKNVSTYEVFLNTLVRGNHASEAINFLKVMKGKNCLPASKFLSNALDILVKQNDSAHVIPLWDIMLSIGFVPNLIMYNAIIDLLCNNNDVDNAFRFLDEMVFYGAFPDALIYNKIFQCLIKNKKVCEAGKFFVEMIKNECPPTHSNCAAAITLLFAGDDPETAIEIWEYMVDNFVSPLDDSANALLIGLYKMGRLTDLRGFSENMLVRRINIYESTMGLLKIVFYKEGRSAQDIYDHLSRKWKNVPR
ncbi:unnamed protein product [Ilex paraguariensis]|uniref:Pentatricopeptide repeat-containing protein n=1 Tax=Ilex paraguariensis TaxID=185542 RepID=A0ABC8T4S5_9AQUA